MSRLDPPACVSNAITSAQTSQGLKLESFSFSMGLLADTVKNVYGNTISKAVSSIWNWFGGK